MCIRHYIAPMSVALAIAAVAVAHAEPELTEVQTAAADVSIAQPATLRVTGSADREDLTYALGDAVRFFVETNEDAYVIIVNVGPDGDVTQLFPNTFQSDNFLEAKEKIDIPAAKGEFDIRVTGPVGAELVKFFAFSKPIELIPNSQLESDGVFSRLKGGASQLARNLQVIANSPVEPIVATHNLVIRTAENISGGPSVTVVQREPDTAAEPTPDAAKVHGSRPDEL